MKKFKVMVFILFILTSSKNLFSQTFTRITDLSNPVVSDQYESGGGSWADINNDGWPDLFVANGNLSNQNNSLYINNRAGSFIKITSGPVVNDGGSSIGGVFGDYNNDGNPDLFVTNRNFFKNFFYSGTGDSVFSKILTGNIVTDSANSNCAHWVDIDNDGDLDLFVLNFLGNDFLYMNSGEPDYSFTKSDSLPFLINAGDFSIPAVWSDYNNDLLPDLFVGNGGSQNDFIYRNNGNLSFEKFILTDGRTTLGASWGDFDNDGDLDLFASSFLGQNNILYVNSGFPDYTLTPDINSIISNNGGSSVGSCWGDIDNDGDLDLFVANDNNENNFLYLNNGPPNYDFQGVSTGEIVNNGGNSFGCVFGDYNRDGAIDLFVANRLNQSNFLYLNDNNGNNFLSVKCRGTVSNRSAIGTKVRVKAVINGQETWQMREVQSQSGYNSENTDLNFGLGNAAHADTIEVRWISGMISLFTNQSVNREITISEDGSVSSVRSENSLPALFDLHQNFPNPFNPSTAIKFSILEPGQISLDVFDYLGRKINNLTDGYFGTGSYEFNFNGEGLNSGIYFYRLESGNFSITRKMLFIK